MYNLFFMVIWLHIKRNFDLLCGVVFASFLWCSSSPPHLHRFLFMIYNKISITFSRFSFLMTWHRQQIWLSNHICDAMQPAIHPFILPTNPAFIHPYILSHVYDCMYVCVSVLAWDELKVHVIVTRLRLRLWLWLAYCSRHQSVRAKNSVAFTSWTETQKFTFIVSWPDFLVVVVAVLFSCCCQRAQILGLRLSGRYIS